ncbi:class A sortase [Leuconostoc citreum]|uniref:class A sortase n=1 Tax=Leuconostoc citreum TaxID=33964 RepID=UPI0011BB7775|nr:class A sortase [Leuconostoc citreum]QEA46259.1 class A sortase [Leuconostoc citreum]QEA62949.1 class A sortase [Leuconostoc citreum]
MAINLEQVKKRQVPAPKTVKRHKRHPILSTFLFAVMSILIVTGAVIYGNHPQWRTAQQVKKLSANHSKQAVVTADKVNSVAKQKGVTPDYTGTGGLTTTAKLLKMAKSDQAEILRGHVAMPSFKIREAVYEGTSNHVLAIGAGMNAPNLKFGQGVVPIFAHNMGDYNSPYGATKFSALQNMTEKTALGKPIYLSDGKTVYTYKATQLAYGMPVGQMNQSLTVANTGKAKVKLIACLEDQEFWAQVKKSNYTNYTAKKRIVLTGELVNEQPLSSIDGNLQQQLK